VQAYPDKGMRIATCPHVLDKTDIEAAGQCPIALAARCNRLQALPMRDPKGTTPKKAKALLSDEQRLMGEESEGSDMENGTGELESEDSGASEGEPLSDDDCQKGESSQPAAVKPSRAWTRLCRQGLCSDGWLPLLQALCPNIIVICVLTSSGYGAPALFSGVSRHKGGWKSTVSGKWHSIQQFQAQGPAVHHKAAPWKRQAMPMSQQLLLI